MHPRSNESLVELAAVTFSSIDYVVFALFLSLSTAVGIFFYCRGGKTTKDYFLGNRQIGAIPMGLSTGVSFMSTASLMGFPAEMFVNGYSYSLAIFSGTLGLVLTSCLVSSIVQPLQITTLSDYFMKRHNSKALCGISKAIVLLCMMHYMGVCMLGSIVAFNTLTGGQISVVLSLVIGGAVGIFYTCMGGLKAVIWSDVLQSAFMMLGILILVIKSVMDVEGGMTEILQQNLRYGRIHAPDWSFDPRVRHNIWGLVFMNFFNWMTYVTQPAFVQRLGALRSLKDCYITSVIAGLLFIFFCTLPSLAGINIFGYYASMGCDIYRRGWAEKNDIIVYYVRDRLSLPGFQGLFLAALFAGSFSSLSSALNASSAILWDDIFRPLLAIRVSEIRAVFFSKIIVIVVGTLGMLWCYGLYSFGGMILEVGGTLDASIYGAYCGLFLFSVSVGWINTKGAISGLVASFLITGCLGIGSLFRGRSKTQPMDTTFRNCPRNASESQLPSAEAFEERGVLDEVFSISYLYFTFICLLLNFSVALSVSLCTRRKKIVNPKVLLPCFRKVKACTGLSEGEKWIESNETSEDKETNVPLTLQSV